MNEEVELVEESKKFDNALPRITIEVTEEFKRQIKIKLANEGMTITTLLNNLLTQWLENDKPRSWRRIERNRET